MELSWTCDVVDGVALVRCRLVNDAPVPRRVRIRNRLEGPVLPPRRSGVPEPGWDADGAELRVEPEDSRAAGYACIVADTEPADGTDLSPEEEVDPPNEHGTASPVERRTDPPVEIESVERAPEDPESVADAAAAVRKLGSYRPPRCALPTPGEGTRRTDASRSSRAADGERGGVDTPGDTGDDTAEAAESDAPPRTLADAPEATMDDCTVTDWFDAVEARIELAERLDGADVATATEVVADAGGVAAVGELSNRIDGDAARLREVSERATALADRADRTAVPTDALRRLA